MFKKVLNSMNHSLIPLLKFHPEQLWPHRERKRDIEGLSETRALETRLTGVDPASPGPAKDTTAPLYHSSPLSTARLEDLVLQIQCSLQKKSACSERSVMEGLPEHTGGFEVVADALPLFQAMT